MTPIDPSAGRTSVDKPIPLPFALTVMGLILFGGAALIWRYVYRPALAPNAIRTITPLPDNPRVAGGPPADGRQKLDVLQTAGEADLPDGLHPLAAGDTLVKAGDAYIRIVHVAGQERLAFGYFTLAEQEWEHGYLSQGVRRLLTQEDFARELGLTANQRTGIEKLAAAPAAKWADADRDRFVALYKDPKTRPELVAALASYATQKRAADQKVMAQRIKQIKSILNEKQLARINPIPRWPLTPASSPSAPDRAPRGP